MPHRPVQEGHESDDLYRPDPTLRKRAPGNWYWVEKGAVQKIRKSAAEAIPTIFVSKGKQSALSPWAVVGVYLAIAEHAGDDRGCWPSLAKIAELAGVSQSTATRSIRVLQAIRAIEVRRRFQRASLYFLLPLNEVAISQSDTGSYLPDSQGDSSQSNVGESSHQKTTSENNTIKKGGEVTEGKGMERCAPVAPQHQQPQAIPDDDHPLELSAEEWDEVIGDAQYAEAMFPDLSRRTLIGSAAFCRVLGDHQWFLAILEATAQSQSPNKEIVLKKYVLAWLAEMGTNPKDLRERLSIPQSVRQFIDGVEAPVNA